MCGPGSRGRTPRPSQSAFQGVIVVLEALELQEVFGALALLVGGQVGDLDGGGAGAFRWDRQVLGRRLVLPLGAASPGLDAVGRKETQVVEPGESACVVGPHCVGVSIILLATGKGSRVSPTL